MSPTETRSRGWTFAAQELTGGGPRALDGLHVRIAEVEEEQERAACIRIDRRDGAHRRGGREVDRVEGGNRLAFPVVEELEVRGLESAHRIAITVEHRDRHLDEVNLHRLLGKER